VAEHSAPVPGRVVAILLLVLLLAGCSEDEPERPSGRTSLSPESTAEPGDGGALDAVDDSLTLDTATNDTFVYGLVLDPDGEPVVLVGDGDGVGLELLRPTRTEGWMSVPSSAFGEDADIRDLLGATADGVLAVVEQAGRPQLCRVAPDATVTCTSVPGAADDAEIASGLLTPDAATLYLLSGPADGPFTVTSADPATGTVRASADAPPGSLVGLAGTDLVFLDTGTVQEDHAEITRLTPDLQQVDAVEFDASYVRSSGGVEDTVYASRLVQDDEDFLAEVSLLALPEGTTEAETVWSIPDAPLVDELGAPVVDPDGAWAYLPTQQHERGGDAIFVRLTPVDLDTGEPVGSVTLCDGYQFGGMAIDPDGDRAFVAVRCIDSGVPTLFTVR
jgi:hypothetical protein